jgi:hypothetical protein
MRQTLVCDPTRERARGEGTSRTHARLGAVVANHRHGVLTSHLLQREAVSALGLLREVEEVAVRHLGKWVAVGGCGTREKKVK